MAVTD